MYVVPAALPGGIPGVSDPVAWVVVLLLAVLHAADGCGLSNYCLQLACLVIDVDLACKARFFLHSSLEHVHHVNWFLCCAGLQPAAAARPLTFCARSTACTCVADHITGHA